jgi:hypothetical protein
MRITGSVALPAQAPHEENAIGTGAIESQRSCGPCSLCCTVLRVDEIAKLGGTPCQYIQSGGGCKIHQTRPAICRGYECLWLRGKLRDEDRPDRLGAVIDLVPTGIGLRLSIRQTVPGTYDGSPRLQEIANEFRQQMPVRITDVEDVLDPQRPFRILLADGEENIVVGDTVTYLRDGVEIETRKLPWPERLARHIALRWRSFRLRQLGSK